MSCCLDESLEEKTSRWIREHKKPITVVEYGTTERGYTLYTLTDANGEIFATGRLLMTLPDTIKAKP